MKKLRVGLIGIGNRGSAYYNLAIKSGVCEVVSIVDFKLEQQLKLLENVDNVKYLFTNTEDFYNANIKLDLLIISSMDKYHYLDAKRGLERGYNLLLEKPIACKYEEVIELNELAKKKNLKVVVCHVLRYAVFYKEIKRIITENILGDIVNINATENVAYWHQCHSYVRGNWHNTKETAPQILTKCSHDLDLLVWLMNKNVKRVSSFGDLYLFKSSNKPIDSSNRCYNCKLGYNCDFNAYKFYMQFRTHLIPFIGNDLSDEKIDEYLKTSDYGRCVYDMDNDTVDHQIVNLEFEDKTTACLTMNAFTTQSYRDIKIYGTKGDLVGNFEDKKISVNLFTRESFTIDITKLTENFAGHGGGDAIMFKELLDYLLNGNKTTSLTLINESVVSHKLAFLAESSRLNNGNSIEVE